MLVTRLQVFLALAIAIVVIVGTITRLEPTRTVVDTQNVSSPDNESSIVDDRLTEEVAAQLPSYDPGVQLSFQQLLSNYTWQINQLPVYFSVINDAFFVDASCGSFSGSSLFSNDMVTLSVKEDTAMTCILDGGIDTYSFFNGTYSLASTSNDSIVFSKEDVTYTAVRLLELN